MDGSGPHRKLAREATRLTRLRAAQRRATAALPGSTGTRLPDPNRLWAGIDSIPDGFALFDPADRLVAANRAYLSVFHRVASDLKPGISYAEILDLCRAHDLVDLGEKSARAWRALMLGRRAIGDGTPTTVRFYSGEHVRLTDLRLADGSTVSLGVNVTDMMRLRAALEAIPDGFVLYDREERLVMCNARYRSAIPGSEAVMKPGAPLEEVLRFGLERGAYSDAIGREEEWLSARLARHRAANVFAEQRFESGRVLRVFERPTPDGGRVGLWVDITELKSQQLELERARAEAVAASRAKSVFLANMSHEIRTPMNGVIGMAELMCETRLDEEQRLFAESIRSSGEALLVIINDILDYSKIEAGRMTLMSEAFDLERTIHDVVRLVQPNAAGKELDLLVDYDMFLPAHFRGDPGRVRQILLNLVGNAVKFTEKGFVLVRVVGAPSGDGEGQDLRIVVEDTGIGIAPDRIEHVFGEFNQVEDETNRRFEGTGLGLAITRRLVEMMDGEIWVKSRPGEGSCFGMRLELPVAEEGDAPMAPALPFGSVLVVDDLDTNRLILERQLGHLGIRTRLVGSSDEALELLAQPGTDPVDAVLTDHHMPGCDGVELARRIRARYDHMPVFLLTSCPTVPREAREDGLFQGILPKPLLRRDLVAALAGCGPQTVPTQVAAAATLPPPASVETKAVRVLAAEDNRTNRVLLAHMLAGLPLNLNFVVNGREAVEAFRDNPADIVLMDVSMPELDGLQATAQIRAFEVQEGRQPVPIVALTAHAMAEDEARFRAAGMTHYLTKPLHKARLIDVLAELGLDTPPAALVAPPRNPRANIR